MEQSETSSPETGPDDGRVHEGTANLSEVA